MTDRSRNNAAKTRGRPFGKGNPGRPKGARHRLTLAAEALLDGEAEALTRKAIELALGGETIALRPQSVSAAGTADEVLVIKCLPVDDRDQPCIPGRQLEGAARA
jgi:hypothetical protein